MTKNTHQYQITKTIPETVTVTEVLPPGRYLEANEKIKAGDLRLFSNHPFKKVPDNDFFIDSGVCPTNVGKFYRLEPKKKVNPNSKYRVLKPNELIKEGDVWFSPTIPNGHVVTKNEVKDCDYPSDVSWRTYKRRLHTKTKVTPKYITVTKDMPLQDRDEWKSPNNDTWNRANYANFIDRSQSCWKGIKWRRLVK